MEPITRLTRLLRALRLQQPTTQAQGTGELPAKLNLDQLNRRIGERINRLAPEERRGDKAVQLFVDSVLAWEFGEELLQSHAFSQYSKKVRNAIKNDTNLNSELTTLLNSLTR